MANLGMLRKEAIKVILDIVQANYYIELDNHFDCLIR